MKSIIFFFILVVVVTACDDSQTKATASGTEATAPTTATTPSVDLPYKPTYSSNFTMEVSDADLKTVLMAYKEWADGNMTKLGQLLTDSVTVIFSSGDVFNGTSNELMKRWSTFRDSLSSVTIEMQAWQKMHEPDKKESAILAWYKEIDTYKTGKVDSAYYHDVNGIKNGKISYYAQYKRPAK